MGCQQQARQTLDRWHQIDWSSLIKLRGVDQVAELMSLGFSTQEIAEIRGHSRASTNAQIQRIRSQLGGQAI